MSPHRADPELDDLIADILIDAYDHDEALMGFENAFDEADCFPCLATILGEPSRSSPSPPPTAAKS